MNDVFAGFKVFKVADAGASADGSIGMDMGFPFREDAVGFRHDDEVANFKAAGKAVQMKHGEAAPFSRGEMLVETFARCVKEFGVMRFVRAEFSKARQGRSREVVGRHVRRRGISGEDDRTGG